MLTLLATLPGQSFTIVAAGSLSGTFADVLGMPNPALPGLQWTVAYTPTSAILSTTALPGDIDLDGDVDRGDAVAFARFFGQASASIWTSGDFNADAATTLADLSLLQANLGAMLTAPGPSAAANPARSAAVPEPSAMLLLLGAMVMVLAARNATKSLDSESNVARNCAGGV